eukprot:GDKK01061416.1.p1 GENE.GDKK01061416.1~~GDKK01061416.1.p1  ORF type:complete len:613 (+),score=105.29 GDKK01061416.1:108-1841(+)
MSVEDAISQVLNNLSSGQSNNAASNVTSLINNALGTDLLSVNVPSASTIVQQSPILTASQADNFNNAFQAALLTAAGFEQVPVADLAYSIEAMRQTGLLKRYNLVTDDTLKAQSAPPTGTEPAIGQCYTPTLSADKLTWTGGMTCCIPTSALQNGTKKPPYLGGVETTSCQATIMSKGSSFDGNYCATTSYSNSPCSLTKHKVSNEEVIIEAYLKHNEAMNNVICRCYLKSDGTAIVDAQYDINVSAVKNATNSAGAQTATVFASLSDLINTQNIITSASVMNDAAKLMGWTQNSTTVNAQSTNSTSSGRSDFIDLSKVNATDSNTAVQVGTALGSLTNMFIDNAVSPALSQSIANGQKITPESVGSVNSGSNASQLYAQGTKTFVTLFNSATNTLKGQSTATGANLNSLSSIFGSDVNTLMNNLFGLKKRRLTMLKNNYVNHRRRLQQERQIDILQKPLPDIPGVSEEEKQSLGGAEVFQGSVCAALGALATATYYPGVCSKVIKLIQLEEKNDEKSWKGSTFVAKLIWACRNELSDVKERGICLLENINELAQKENISSENLKKLKVAANIFIPK